jgi:hypothetical protein
MKMLMTIAMLLGLLIPASVRAEDVRDVKLYKNPQCSCCEGYADYLRKNGFKVTVSEADDLNRLQKEHGIPVQLYGCHMSLVGGYVVEGHVSIDLINRLLAEKPHIIGISLPAMPMGVPGMGGTKDEELKVYEIAPDAPVYGTQ